MILDNIFKEFISTKEKTLREKTVRSYISAYNKHISTVFGSRTLDTINYIDYQKFADSLISLGKAPKTVKNILRLISSITTYAYKCDYYNGKDYVSLVELPHFDNKFYVNFSASIQKRYLLALKNAREKEYKDIFLFLLHGRRLREVLDFEWEYLDLHTGIAYYPASRNKAKKFLSYELSSDLIEALKQRHNDAIDLQRTVFPTGYVFLNPNTSKPYSDIRKAWKRLLKQNNLSYISIHKIRNILPTYLINELGVSIEHVSFLLGHSSIAMTERYRTVKPNIAKKTIDILFEDMKNKGDKYIENLNETLRVGGLVQTLLFPDKEPEKIMHKVSDIKGSYYY